MVMKKLNELLYNQKQLVKYMEKSHTIGERLFYQRSIEDMEEEIEKTRKELGLK